MCELLAVSSRRPTTINVSLVEFARHGGLVGPHRDGWGLACYDDGEVRVIREPEPASSSAWLRFFREQRLRSNLFVCHIRHATQGAPALKNTQPYVRELGGRTHVFVHNGDLPLGDGRHVPLGRFRPVGQTDSELIFCHLLSRMERLWLASGGVPPIEARLAVVHEFAAFARAIGPSNFVYCDGEAFFAHGDVRRHDGETGTRPPGLHALWRNFVSESDPLNAFGLQFEPDQQAVLVASAPLTREKWIPLPRGEILAISGGRLVAGLHGIEPGPRRHATGSTPPVAS
jgi:glutamine amidotransferase